ncbi:urotensin 1 [Limanda limanda]|uniref:urotensin 1 n=1 Tax=Limanda limanda TaxID=27771 RepID=UPI0029C724B9|nr:urotensin 1 [Limanda limanda]
MKPASLLLLLSSVLLSSHLLPAAGRPRAPPGWLDGSGRLQTQRLDEELLGDNILRFLRRTNPEHLLHQLPAGEGDQEEEVGDEEVLRSAVQLLKRSEEPPMSIDLTFHMLRNMIHMAKVEGEREQALLNRNLLDEVGK